MGTTGSLEGSAAPLVTILTGSDEEQIQAGLLIDGLREFGGSLADSPVLLLQCGPVRGSRRLHGLQGVRVSDLDPHPDLPRYLFSSKVLACARAEALAREEGLRTLIWLSSHSLVLAPPLLLNLAGELRAALRAVHISNVGSCWGEYPDSFWQAVYGSVGCPEPSFPVESFVDSVLLRPYYNTHLFSIDPAVGLLARWLDEFIGLVSNDDFQAGPCRDATHKIFLHQAVFSALIGEMLNEGEIRMLPPGYSYPLHLHDQLPPERAAERLNDLIVAVYEDYHGIPEAMEGILVEEPLLSWLNEGTR